MVVAGDGFADLDAGDTDSGGLIRMTPRLEEVIEHVKALSSDELRQLRDTVDDLLVGSHQPLTEDELEQRLIDLGVLDRAVASIAHAPVDVSFRPVEVRGKPVSETIVEERR